MQNPPGPAARNGFLRIYHRVCITLLLSVLLYIVVPLAIVRLPVRRGAGDRGRSPDRGTAVVTPADTGAIEVTCAPAED